MPKELNLPLKAQHKSKKQLLCVQVVIPNVTDVADCGTFGELPKGRVRDPMIPCLGLECRHRWICRELRLTAPSLLRRRAMRFLPMA